MFEIFALARKKSKESMSLDERNNSDAMMASKDSSSKFPRAKGQSQFKSENSANTKTQSNADEDNSKRKHLNTSENEESRKLCILLLNKRVSNTSFKS